MYLKIEEINETNTCPIFVFTPNKNSATEFIIVKKSDNSVAFRLNVDMKNQNETFGYHLYVIPENDIVYGAGNDELYAQFNLEKHDNYIYIKSIYKNTYLCHEYNILRCRNMGRNVGFTLEDARIPFNQRSICLMTYGYMRNPINLNNSPIINSLKEIYPQTNIDIYLFLPNIIDEFYNVSFDVNGISADRCNIFPMMHSNDYKYFMKASYSHGLPIISNKEKHYTYRTMSMLWNITESVRNFLVTKKVYNTYILMRNDMFAMTDVLKKIIDVNKLYCMNNNELDSHLFIGRDILSFNYLYDFYLRNKNTYADYSPNQIIFEFLKSNNIRLGDIHHVSPNIRYPSNFKKNDDAFYKLVIAKYKELFKNN